MNYDSETSRYETIIKVFRIYSKSTSTRITYEEDGVFNTKYPRVNVLAKIETQEGLPYGCADLRYDYFNYYPNKKEELRREVELANSDPDFSWRDLGLRHGFYFSHPKMTEQEAYYAFLHITWTLLYPEKMKNFHVYAMKTRQFLEHNLDGEEWETIDNLLQKGQEESLEAIGIDRSLFLYYIYRNRRFPFICNPKNSIFQFRLGRGRRITGKIIEMKHELGTDAYFFRYKNDYKEYILGVK